MDLTNCRLIIVYWFYEPETYRLWSFDYLINEPEFENHELEMYRLWILRSKKLCAKIFTNQKVMDYEPYNRRWMDYQLFEPEIYLLWTWRTGDLYELLPTEDFWTMKFTTIEDYVLKMNRLWILRTKKLCANIFTYQKVMNYELYEPESNTHVSHMDSSPVCILEFSSCIIKLLKVHLTIKDRTMINLLHVFQKFSFFLLMDFSTFCYDLKNN